MSDTVKLIVDIPVRILDTIQADEMISREQLAILQTHIQNATPLDDVKAEINKAQEPYITNTAYDEGVRFGLMLAYQIVDRCKAESEGTNERD